jgi:hypothetical protein
VTAEAVKLKMNDGVRVNGDAVDDRGSGSVFVRCDEVGVDRVGINRDGVSGHCAGRVDWVVAGIRDDSECG